MKRYPLRRGGSRRTATVPVIAVVAALVAAVLAGCTGVPSNSTPQVVTRVGGAQLPSDPSTAPPVGADPRTIVVDFLQVIATDDPHHSAARSFLTPNAIQRWQDTSVTVFDGITVGTPKDGASGACSSGNCAVSVSGRPVGTVSSAGVYRPQLDGDGRGGSEVVSPFTLKQVAGQWRIDTLPSGVLLDTTEFEQLYTQRELYFYDLAEQHLVPDPRFTAITDPALLSTWLLTQLVGGPRPELQNAVTTEFPSQLDPSRVSVAVGAPSVIALPGAAQLDGTHRNRLAAQLAETLVQVPAVNDMKITDSGKDVSIPLAAGVRFGAGVFQSAVAPQTLVPSVYYMRGGGVVDESARPLPGRVGNGAYGLVSAAIASGGAPDLRVAGVTGTGNAARLLIGTVATGLRPTSLVGPLSRPAWVPGIDEVWIGDGAKIYRCGPDGKPIAVVPTLTTGGQLPGSVTALRLSPEGSRVAMVVSGPGDSAQVWVGSVVRNAAQVRIDGLEPITPTKIAIKDVAWNDPLKLFVIGRSLDTDDTNIYEVQVDGSFWTVGTVLNLPSPPDSITVAANQPAWVSAGSPSSVWVRRAGAWASPGVGFTLGTNPVYLE